MLSRTADHIYWLGRYVERAETLARALDVQHQLSLLPQPPDLVARPTHYWSAFRSIRSLSWLCSSRIRTHWILANFWRAPAAAASPRKTC